MNWSIWDDAVPLGAAAGVFWRAGAAWPASDRWVIVSPSFTGHDEPIALPVEWFAAGDAGSIGLWRLFADGRVRFRLIGAGDAAASEPGPDLLPEIRDGLAILLRLRSGAIVHSTGIGGGTDDDDPYDWTAAALAFGGDLPAAGALVWAGAGSPIDLDAAETTMDGVDPALVLRGADRGVLMRAAAPERAVITAVEVRHPDLATPIRVVDDVAAREIGGERYAPLRFGARLAQDAEGEAPRAQLVMDNVGRELMQWIEAAGGAAGATARVMQVVEGDAAPDWEMTLDVHSISADQAQVHAELGFDPLLGRAAVAWRHDPDRTPGIF